MMNNIFYSKPLSHNEVKRDRALRTLRQRYLHFWLAQIGQAMQYSQASNYK